MCVCRGCYLLFTDDHAELRYRAVPDRYLSFPDFALGRREWEVLQIPVGLAFFFRNSALDRTVAFYPGSGGRDGIRAGSRRVERHSRRRPAGGHARRRHRGADRAGARRRNRSRPNAIWCRSTPATSSSGGCGCSGTASTAASRCATFIDEFFDHVDRDAGKVECSGSRMTEVTFAVARRGAGTLRGDTGADRAGRHRGGRRRSRCTPSRCAARSASNRCAAATPTTRPPGCSTCSARANAGAPPNAPSCGNTAPRWCPDSPAPPRSTCRWSAPTTSRSTAAKYLHALRDGTIPLQFLFSGTVFTQGDARLRGAAGAVGPRRPLRHAGVGVA